MGFWHVAKHPAKEKQEDWSRVYYSVQLRIPNWIPGLVIGYLNKKAIREVWWGVPCAYDFLCSLCHNLAGIEQEDHGSR